MIHELVLVGVSFFHPQPFTDSLGVETVNGKILVIHKVDEKETLYAIARRYGASVDAIKSANPGMSTTLDVGQILKVPYTRGTTTASSKGKHVVQPKETMYSISRQYGVSVDDLKKWNNLGDNALSVGQELIVKNSQGGVTTRTETTPQPTTRSSSDGTHTVATKETLFSIARLYGVSVAQLRSWNSLANDELQVGQTIMVAESSARNSQTVASQPKVEVKENTGTPTRTEPSTQAPAQNSTQSQAPKVETTQPRNEPVASGAPKSQTIRISESMKNSDEIMESGIAELIEGTEGNRKYLALHRTAPVGTILKVRNEMNNREVFVRVMGKLPETSVNDKLVIKISRSAYDRLGAIDPRFRVELTYYK
jgi:LysM repeat protein